MLLYSPIKCTTTAPINSLQYDNDEGNSYDVDDGICIV